MVLVLDKAQRANEEAPTRLEVLLWRINLVLMRLFGVSPTERTDCVH